ncbi:MAG: amidohydrolase family protein [Candidatus Nanopelagicales bacterium]|nr:amidohydrolase family protein [Candidatus Nanopelagicales bacterium]
MNIDDMVMVSIDDHIIEGPDTFKYFPEALKDQAPKLAKDPSRPEFDAWVFQGAVVGNIGLSAVMGLPKDEWAFDPTTISEMRPGAYDWDQRVRDMNANGTLAQTQFPTFAGFAGSHLASMPDKNLVNLAIKAYNDYYVGDICNAYPGRFIPLGVVSTFDIDEAVKEVHRLGKMGCRTISLPETPYGVGLPSYASGYWDPVLAAMVDNNIVASFHIGGGFGLLQRPETARIDDMIVLASAVSMICFNDIMLGGVIKKFPDLKVAMSEGGVGWVSFLLDRIERHIDNQLWTGLDCLPKGMTATEVWKKNFIACFITEPSGLDSRSRIGIETIAWESDYPHSDSTWPYSPERLLGELNASGLTDAEINMVTHENVARFFDWDPFQHCSREQATVGALRALAADVDITPTPKAEYRRRYDEKLANA